VKPTEIRELYTVVVRTRTHDDVCVCGVMCIEGRKKVNEWVIRLRRSKTYYGGVIVS
jgi:hypothetical protein